MPRKYNRAGRGLQRAQWTEENLKEAIKKIGESNISINQASRSYGIPARTLRRRLATGIFSKLPLGPRGILSTKNEKLLVNHILKLEASGLTPDRNTVRALAFQLAEYLGINHRFNRETKMAGNDWLLSFLERNKELNIRSVQGLSIAKYPGMTQEQIGFCDLILEVEKNRETEGKQEIPIQGSSYHRGSKDQVEFVAVQEQLYDPVSLSVIKEEMGLPKQIEEQKKSAFPIQIEVIMPLLASLVEPEFRH